MRSQLQPEIPINIFRDDGEFEVRDEVTTGEN